MKFALILSATTLLVASVATATPPGKPAHYYTQASGEKVMLQSAGNAEFHWFETRRGHIVVYNKHSKNYEYAKVDKANNSVVLQPSGVVVGELAKHAAFKPLTRKDLPKAKTRTTQTP